MPGPGIEPRPMACQVYELTTTLPRLSTTIKAASVRKQLATKNNKTNEGRQEKNGGVKGRNGSVTPACLYGTETMALTERSSQLRILQTAHIWANIGVVERVVLI